MKRNTSIIPLILLLWLCFNGSVYSQNVGINLSGSTPSQNAILDLNTGNSGNLGIIIPNVTLGALLTSFNPPIAHVNSGQDVGMLVYNSSAASQPIGYYYWNGTTWVSVGAGNPWFITGNTGITASSSAIGATANNNFIGTTDAADFVLAAAGLERMRIAQSTGFVGINTILPGAQLDVQGLTTATNDIVNVTGNSVTSGSVLDVNSSATAPTNGLAHFNFTGIHSGNGIQLDDANTGGTAMTLNANSITTGVGNGLVINTNGITSGTGNGLLVSSTSAYTAANGLLRVNSNNIGTEGPLLLISSNSSTVVNNGLVRFRFTGAYAGNGFQIDASTTAGTVMALNANSITTGVGKGLVITTNGITSGTGNALLVSSTSAYTGANGLSSVNSANAGTTGPLFLATSNSTGAVSNGLVRFQYTAAHTGNGFEIDDATTAGNAMQINANSLVGGTGLAVTSTNTGLTGNLFDVQTASTSNLAGGVEFDYTGDHTGNGFQIDDVTTAGTIMQMNGNSLTGGTGLNMSFNHLSTGTGLNMSANVLGAGNGLAITSTSGSITGSLANLTANSTNTGNLLNIAARALTTGNGMFVTANNLTSGSGIYVSSSSSGITSGALVTLSSTGAITNASGSVLNVNSTGANTNGYVATFTGNNATSGGIVNVAGNALSSGDAVDISSTSTNRSNSTMVNVTSSGTNSAPAQTNYGVSSTISNTNATSATNYAGYFSANGSGANVNNYAVVVPSGGGNVGIGTTTPATSAMIDLTNTNATGGTGAPLLWSTNPSPSTNIVNPVLGEEIYNTTTGCFNFYNGAAWLVMQCPCQTAPATPTISGCTGTFVNSAVTYTSSVTSGVIYNWSVTGDASASANGYSTITATWPAVAGSGTLGLSLSNTCGSASASSLPVTIYGDPTISGTTPVNISTTGNTYTVTAVAGATYAWSTGSTDYTIPGSATSQTVAVSTDATAGSFTLTCTVSLGACGSYSATLPVTVIVPCTSITGVAPGSPANNTCSGSTYLATTGTAVTYTIAPVTHATSYTWASSSTDITLNGSTTNTVTITPSGTAPGAGLTVAITLSVTANNSCDGTHSNVGTVTIDLYGLSPMTFNNSAVVQTWTEPCNLTTFTITAYGALGGTSNTGGFTGGDGEEVVSASQSIVAADVIDMLVGEKGSNGGANKGGGGGGGASYVWLGGGAQPANPIVVAGGGGGGSQAVANGGNATSSGGSGTTSAAAGTNNFSGAGGTSWDALGNSGATGNGGNAGASAYSTWPGGTGGANGGAGGYGGGGGGSGNNGNNGGGGGGGGYQGGTGGTGGTSGGGGGSSYGAGAAFTAGAGTGQGQVLITF